MYDDTTYVCKYKWNINKNLHVYFIYSDGFDRSDPVVIENKPKSYNQGLKP